METDYAQTNTNCNYINYGETLALEGGRESLWDFLPMPVPNEIATTPHDRADEHLIIWMIKLWHRENDNN